MPVTFGAVGDIISVYTLVKDLITALSETRGSSAEYQTTIHELQNLESILGERKSLATLCDYIGGYEYLAVSAQLKAEKIKALVVLFSEKIMKFHTSLKLGGSDNRARNGYWKLRWKISYN